jgi:hypothetical protein
MALGRATGWLGCIAVVAAAAACGSGGRTVDLPGSVSVTQEPVHLGQDPNTGIGDPATLSFGISVQVDGSNAPESVTVGPTLLTVIQHGNAGCQIDVETEPGDLAGSMLATSINVPAMGLAQVSLGTPRPRAFDPTAAPLGVLRLKLTGGGPLDGAFQVTAPATARYRLANDEEPPSAPTMRFLLAPLP